MGRTYYAQSDRPASTLTVGQLIKKLQMFDHTALVIFKSPLYGSFGSHTAYSIEEVEQIVLPYEELIIPEETYEDEETGDLITRETETQIFYAWTGVVIR
jgi:hypothetical protein